MYYNIENEILNRTYMPFSRNFKSPTTIRDGGFNFFYYNKSVIIAVISNKSNHYYKCNHVLMLISRTGFRTVFTKL